MKPERTDMGADGRAVILTGSSQGLGAAAAERLACDGWAVTIKFSGSGAPAAELAQRIRPHGGWVDGQTIRAKCEMV